MTMTQLTDTPLQAPMATPVDEFDLDVAFIESGEEIDKLIHMTDDGCGSSCQSACSNSCR